MNIEQGTKKLRKIEKLNKNSNVKIVLRASASEEVVAIFFLSQTLTPSVLLSF